MPLHDDPRIKLADGLKLAFPPSFEEAAVRHRQDQQRWMNPAVWGSGQPELNAKALAALDRIDAPSEELLAEVRAVAEEVGVGVEWRQIIGGTNNAMTFQAGVATTRGEIWVDVFVTVDGDPWRDAFARLGLVDR